MDTKAVANILGPRFEAAVSAGGPTLNELGLPEGAAVLDVGTGNGYFAIYLALRGYQVLTGEPATDTTQYARRDWTLNAEKAGVRDRICFRPFDAASLPFEAASFEAVFFFGVLHHIPEDQRTYVFREALRVAKPTGAVVFFEPRQNLLEQIRVDDPSHPPAADPSAYLPSPTLSLQRIESPMLDVFIYRKST